MVTVGLSDRVWQISPSGVPRVPLACCRATQSEVCSAAGCPPWDISITISHLMACRLCRKAASLWCVEEASLSLRQSRAKACAVLGRRARGLPELLPCSCCFHFVPHPAPRTNPSCTPQPPLITSAQENWGVPPKHNHKQPAGRGLVPGWGCRGISGFVFLGAAEHTSRLS